MAHREPKINIEIWAIDKLKPYARNNRIHTPAAVEKLAKLIQEFGFDQPIVLAPSGEIIKGHRRYLAAQLLNLKSVPVIIRDDLTAAQITASRLADNATATDSDYDYQAIAIDLQALLDADYDLALTGLEDTDEILDLLNAVAADEANPHTERKMGNPAKMVKPVLYMPQVAQFEQALRLTGIKNRGEALTKICEFYLQAHGQIDIGTEGQFDFLEQAEATAIGHL